MPAYRSHGREYVEPPRADELPDGVKAVEQAEASGERTQDGRPAQGARTIPALGGKAHKGKSYLSHQIVAPTLDPANARRARVLRNHLSREIAKSVGGGSCGVAASLFLKFAAQKTAAAEQAYQAGDFDTHRKLSESARMDILYAREHAAKEAEARPRDPNAVPEWLAAINGAHERELAASKKAT